MFKLHLGLGINQRIQIGSNNSSPSLPVNRITEEDSTLYFTEEDSNQILISEN